MPDDLEIIEDVTEKDRLKACLRWLIEKNREAMVELKKNAKLEKKLDSLIN